MRHQLLISWRCLCLLALLTPAFAHVGTTDIFFDGNAGPYRLMVTIRPPAMIPGIAAIEIRAGSAAGSPAIRAIRAVPLYMVGEGSKYPPAPDTLSPAKDDPQFFTGGLWIMGSGSWQVRLEATGPAGSGTLAVPVPAFATRTLPMQRGLGWFLFAAMLFLVAALIAILGAGRREGFLPPGTAPGPAQSRRAAASMAVAAVVLAAILFFGNRWWDSSADGRARGMIYRPPTLSAALEPGGRLVLRMVESQWHKNRPATVMTQLIPDHGHLMHLFLVRTPAMDRFYHLHPEKQDGQTFSQQLPALPAGHYQIFADIVRASGFPDTMTAAVDLPEVLGKAPSGDDSEASAPALGAAQAGDAAAQPSDGAARPSDASARPSDAAPLHGGGRMVWERPAAPLRARQALWFRFRVEDEAGKPAGDLEPYMGMAGHAEFISFDRSVFAHVHPEGSVAMAALALASVVPAGMAGMHHPMAVPPEISFPYGLPKAGDYRLFVQVKRAGGVRTGTFDMHVEP
jgi:hypothetical protein